MTREQPMITLAELDRLLAKLAAADIRRIVTGAPGNRQAGKPTAAEIAARLRRRIQRGYLPSGTVLPPATEIAAAYGVVAKIARQATGQLRAEGLLVGRGNQLCVAPRSRPPAWT